ncbi:MAG: hypothetical protein LBF70_00135 [Holosporales bacterium]|jgi:hypothetical protein|nr:hypothetical protein [Holosporales bacterium]
MERSAKIPTKHRRCNQFSNGKKTPNIIPIPKKTGKKRGNLSASFKSNAEILL